MAAFYGSQRKKRELIRVYGSVTHQRVFPGGFGETGVLDVPAGFAGAVIRLAIGNFWAVFGEMLGRDGAATF